MELNGVAIDAKDFKALKNSGLEPTSEVGLQVKGPDAEQARKVLENLSRYCFYVEEALGRKTEQKVG